MPHVGERPTTITRGKLSPEDSSIGVIKIIVMLLFRSLSESEASNLPNHFASYHFTLDLKATFVRGLGASCEITGWKVDKLFSSFMFAGAGKLPPA